MNGIAQFSTVANANPSEGPDDLAAEDRATNEFFSQNPRPTLMALARFKLQIRECSNKKSAPSCDGGMEIRERRATAVPGCVVANSGSKYPSLPVETMALAHDELVARSIEIAIQFRKEKDYARIRDDFLEVSFALNQLGLLAPAFRDQPRTPYKKALWKEFTPLLIDQIVIDCHWLHCRAELVTPKWPELRSMFSASGKFDCEAVATHIAAKGWSCDFRTDELIRLNLRQQVQLMQLRSKELKQKFRILLDGERGFDDDRKPVRKKAIVSRVRMAINEWADRTHQVRGQEDMYEAIWLAIELLGASTKAKDIATLSALRVGVKPLSPKTVSDKIARLMKVLSEAGIKVGE